MYLVRQCRSHPVAQWCHQNLASRLFLEIHPSPVRPHQSHLVNRWFRCCPENPGVPRHLECLVRRKVLAYPCTHLGLRCLADQKLLETQGYLFRPLVPFSHDNRRFQKILAVLVDHVCAPHSGRASWHHPFSFCSFLYFFFIFFHLFWKFF